MTITAPTTFKLLVCTEANPVRAVIADTSGSEPRFTLRCASDIDLSDVRPSQLQTLYEAGMIPDRLAEYLVELGAIEERIEERG